MSRPTYSQEALFGLMQPAKWHGRYFKTKCPFHDDREPSFLVFEDGGQCLSLSCGKRASLRQIYYKLRGLDPPSNVPYTPSPLSWRNMPELETLVDEAHEILVHNQATLGHYLRERGILSITEYQMLGWWLGWYTFPVYDSNHTLIGLMLRASPAMQQKHGIRWLAPPGQTTLLYSPDWAKVRQAKEVWVVFGILDAWTLWRLGFPVISPTFLKGFRAEMLDDIRKPIRLVPDAGEEEYARRIIDRLGWRGHLCSLPYPAAVKDPAGFRQAGLENDLLRLLYL